MVEEVIIVYCRETRDNIYALVFFFLFSFFVFISVSINFCEAAVNFRCFLYFTFNKFLVKVFIVESSFLVFDIKTNSYIQNAHLLLYLLFDVKKKKKTQYF